MKRDRQAATAETLITLFCILPCQVIAGTGPVSIDANSAVGIVGKYFYSTNVDVHVCSIGNDSFYTSPANRAKASAQKFGAIRIPGGGEADGYHWWNGACDVWGQGPGTLPVEVYLDYAEATGTTVQPCVNTGHDSSGKTSATSRIEAANWVEYCNGILAGNTDTSGWTVTSYTGQQSAPIGYFAWLRGQRGHGGPYNVRNWEIGNENFNHQGVYGTVQCYADTLTAYYDAMHARAAAVGSVPIFVGAQVCGAGTWDSVLIATNKYDALIVHWFMGTGAGAQTDSAITAGFSAFNNNVAYADSVAAYLHRKVTQAKYDGTELWLTEVGPDVNAPTNWESLNPWNAVLAAKWMAQAQATTKPYTVFAWNTWSQGDDGSSTIARSSGQVLPVYWAYDIMTHWARGNDTLVSVTGSIPNVDVYAAKLSDGSLEILVLNWELSAVSNVDINISGFPARDSAVLWSYGREQCGWNNTDRSQCQTSPVQQTVSVFGSSYFLLPFPPMSINIMKLAKPPTAVQPTASHRKSRSIAISREGNSYAVHATRPCVLEVFSLDGSRVAKVNIALGVARLTFGKIGGVYLLCIKERDHAQTTAMLVGPSG